jgi:hypothetical protein
MANKTYQAWLMRQAPAGLHEMQAGPECPREDMTWIDERLGEREIIRIQMAAEARRAEKQSAEIRRMPDPRAKGHAQ